MFRDFPGFSPAVVDLADHHLGHDARQQVIEPDAPQLVVSAALDSATADCRRLADTLGAATPTPNDYPAVVSSARADPTEADAAHMIDLFPQGLAGHQAASAMPA